MDETPLTDDQRDHLERRELKRSRQRLENPSPQNLRDEETKRAKEAFQKDTGQPDPPQRRTRVQPVRRSPEELAYLDKQGREAQIVCPYCQTRGSVQTSWLTVESGGPATWSILLIPFTFGLSLLFGWQFPKYGKYGSCDNCGQDWRVE